MELSNSSITTSPEMGQMYRVVVKGLRGETMTVDLCSTEEQMKNMTVRQLKEKIAQQHKDYKDIGVSTNYRLLFGVRALDNDRMLTYYGVQHMSVTLLVLPLRGGGPPGKADGGMGDRESKNRSFERLANF